MPGVTAAMAPLVMSCDIRRRCDDDLTLRNETEGVVVINRRPSAPNVQCRTHLFLTEFSARPGIALAMSLQK